MAIGSDSHRIEMHLKQNVLKKFVQFRVIRVIRGFFPEKFYKIFPYIYTLDHSKPIIFAFFNEKNYRDITSELILPVISGIEFKKFLLLR